MSTNTGVTPNEEDYELSVAIADTTTTTVLNTSGVTDQTVRDYVREVVDAKGTSDEPALDEIEYVRYVTSDERRRRKQVVQADVRAAIPR